MAFTVFDPRKIVRSKIGTDALIEGQIESCIVASDTNGAVLNIPMYTREEAETECPAMPYIIIDVLSIPSVPHDVNASSRYRTCLITFDITYNNMENIEVDVFNKVVADKIVHSIRTYQCTTNSINFMNVSNEGRLMIENRCEDVILHWLMELTCYLWEL